MKSLLLFGDSWPAGGELTKYEKPFGQLLAEQHNLRYKNYSREGASNPEMLLQLKMAVEENDHKDSIAIFFLTSYTRTINWQDKTEPTINAAGYNDLDTMFAKYFYTHDAGQFNTTQSVLALQKICYTLGIDDYYIPGWLDFDLDFPGIDIKKIYNSGKSNIATAIGMPKFEDEIDKGRSTHYLIHPKEVHPNQKAHQLIAEQINNWINFTNNSSRH